MALLLVATPSGPDRALAGEGHHGGGGGGGGGWGGGGGVGVGVGIGVGTILLNQAIRRSQERQAAEPRGCPPELVPSHKGCVKPGKDKGHKGPDITQCDPPKVYRKGKGCVTPKGPDVAKCDHPMVMRKGKCVRPEPEVAKCDHPKIYRKGMGCVLPPTIVLVPPPVVPVGRTPEGPPQIVPAGPAPEEPSSAPPPRQASPVPRQPAEPVALIDPVSNARCLPGDLYDLLEETYGKRPSLDRCPAACLPKPASFTEAELDAAAEKSGINWCDNCVQVGGYMPLASVLTLERAANVTLCVNADMCRLPASIGGPASGVRRRKGHRDPHHLQGPASRHQERRQYRRHRRQQGLSGRPSRQS